MGQGVGHRTEQDSGQPAVALTADHRERYRRVGGRRSQRVDGATVEYVHVDLDGRLRRTAKRGLENPMSFRLDLGRAGRNETGRAESQAGDRPGMHRFYLGVPDPGLLRRPRSRRSAAR